MPYDLFGLHGDPAGLNLPEGGPQDESFLSSIAHTVLSPLVYLGESLSKPGYAVRGLLAGQGPSALLNLIPFSDAMGITDPAQHVTGRDLARQYFGADKEDTWGNFFGGLGLDIVTDPTMLLSGGAKALTQGGLDALKAGKLAATRVGRIEAGQAGLLGIHTPFYTDMLNRFGMPTAQTAIGTGETAKYLAGLLDKGSEALSNVPGMNYLRWMFNPLAGHTTDPAVQKSAIEVGRNGEQQFKAAGRQMLLPGVDLQTEGKNLLEGAGMTPGDAQNQWDRLVNVYLENTPMPTNIMDRYKGVDTIDIPNVHQKAVDLAQQMAQVRQATESTTRQRARDIGIVVGENQDEFRDYGSQQGAAYDNWRRSQQQSRTMTAPLGYGSNEINDMVEQEKTMLPNGNSVQFAGLKNSAVGYDPELYDKLVQQKGEEFFARDLQKKTELLNAGGLSARRQAYLENLSESQIRSNAMDRANTLAELPPEVAAAGRLYDTDPLAKSINYVDNLASQVRTAQIINNTLAREAIPIGTAAAGKLNRGDYQTVAEGLDRLGNNAADIVKQGDQEIYSAGGRVSLANRLAELGKAQLPADMEKGDVNDLLSGFLVKKDLVKSLEQEAAGAAKSGQVGQMIDNVLNPFKAFVTSMPRTHLRTNLDQMLLQPWLSGNLDFGNIGQAEKYVAGALGPGATMNETARSAWVQGVTRNAQNITEAGINRAPGLTSPLIEQSAESTLMNQLKGFFGGYGDVNSWKDYFSFNPEVNPLARQSLKAHNTQGTAARLANYQGLLDQGYKPEVAAKLTNLSQIDYANQLTDFERTIMRRIFPFYGFAKGSALRFADQLQDPGRTQALLDLVTGAARKDTVPAFVSPGSALPVPGGDEGKQRYMAGFGLPQEESGILGLISLLHGDVSGGMQHIASGMNPFVLGAMEQAAGKQIFSGRPLEELQPSKLASLGGLLPNRLAYLVQQIAGATPLSAVTSTVSRPLGGKDVYPLLNLLTGVRTTEVDTAKANKFGAEDELRRMLMSTGEARRREDVYLPSATRDGASPKAQFLYQLLTQIEHAK